MLPIKILLTSNPSKGLTLDRAASTHNAAEREKEDMEVHDVFSQSVRQARRGRS